MVKVVELFAGVGGFRLGLEANETLKFFGETSGNPQLKHNMHLIVMQLALKIKEYM